MSLESLAPLLLVLPLAGFLLTAVIGRRLGKQAHWIPVLGIGAVWLIAMGLVFNVLTGVAPLLEGSEETHGYALRLFTWIPAGEFVVDVGILIDPLTAALLVVVTTVGLLVHVYSIGYMRHDPGYWRFFAYLNLFMFSMLLLVLGDSWLTVFVAWELVGLSSYLLIGFWYRKRSAALAAKKAFIVNRVGDFGFALGIFGLFFVFKTINLDPLFAAAPTAVGKTFNFVGFEVDILTTLALLLFMGAMGKSAQFLLHTWLPDAMEGPTPVSALIHAATMVTAGVFMVARLSPIFELAPTALQVVTFVGAITAFFAATVGLVQNDIKRVIAYSTCSQLGYMFVACGIGAYTAGIFHLFTHAFFKALLFLGAGSVIHAMHHEQDMRNMGGLAPKIRTTYAMMLIGTLALTGVGFPHVAGFAGFHSKDAIIEAAYAAHTPNNYAFWTLVAAALMTSFYSWRLIFLTFHGKSRAEPDVIKHAHESPPVMLIPLAVLAVGAVLSGIVFARFFIGHDYQAFWGKAIFEGPDNHIMHAMHEVPGWVGWAPFAAMTTGLAVAYLYYVAVPWLPAATARAFRPLYLFLLNKWYFDELYDWLFVKPAFWLGRLLWKKGDGAVIDGTIDGTAAGVGWLTGKAMRLQTGYVYHYAFAMMLGVAALVTYFMFQGGGVQ